VVGALDIAAGFIDALDRNAGAAAAAYFAPHAIWWVDSGRNRAAGQFGVDPGEDRSWPLHGAMDAARKCKLLERIGETFPLGLRQITRRAFAGGDFAVIEVEGDGLFRGETPYRNRYAFVIEVRNGAITEVREYLDTAHAARVFGLTNDKRSEAPLFEAAAPLAKTSAGQAGLDLMAAIAAMDPQRLLELCTDDATWWADGGSRRTEGPEGPVAARKAAIVSGRVGIEARAAAVSALAAMFPDGYTLNAHRLIEADSAGDSGLVAVEAYGDGRHANGRRYQNRYCWVLEVRDGKIADIREYCDTLHGFDTLFAKNA
jgi:ketosteroid isomerase-like protein